MAEGGALRTSVVIPVTPRVAVCVAVQAMWRQYGYLFVATYLSVYVVTLSGTYALVENGVIAGPDVNEWLKTSTVKQMVFGDREVRCPPVLVNFMTAWLLTKLTEPVRAAVTVALIPIAVRRLPPRLLRALRVEPKPRKGKEADD